MSRRRNSRSNSSVRGLAIIVILIIAVIGSIRGCVHKDSKNTSSSTKSETSSKNTATSSSTSQSSTSSSSGDWLENRRKEQENKKEESIKSQEESIEAFVDEFNKNSKTKLKYEEDFTPSGRRYESKNEYDVTVGKTYSYGSSKVDFKGHDILVYQSTYEKCKKFFKIAAPIRDSSLTQDDINEVIQAMDDGYAGSGYYYGKDDNNCVIVTHFPENGGCNLEML